MNSERAPGTVTVTHYDTNGTWLIALEGEHDMATATLLEQQTQGVWPRCNLAVVDLRDATFIDCSTINWLLRTRGALTRPGQDILRIVPGPSSGAAGRMFDLLSPRDVFACYPTREDALAQPSVDPERAPDAHAGSARVRQTAGPTLS